MSDKSFKAYLKRSISNTNISPKTPKPKLMNNNQTNIISNSTIDSANPSSFTNSTSQYKKNHEQMQNSNKQKTFVETTAN